MILYKYQSHDVGMQVVTKGKVAFSFARDFNDPFETEAGYPVEKMDPISDLFNGIRSWAARDTWVCNSGILCLTRRPTNPLMWSHYGDEHHGMVIGFDAKTADFLNEDTCLIPADFGSMIYTHSRPTEPLRARQQVEPIEVGQEYRFRVDHFDKLSQLFLQKSSHWSYEEEVRVVKCINGISDRKNLPSGEFELKHVDREPKPKKTLYLYTLPENSIQTLILGMRNPLLNNANSLKAFSEEIAKDHPDCTIFVCEPSKDTWDIRTRSVSDFLKHRLVPEDVAAQFDKKQVQLDD